MSRELPAVVILAGGLASRLRPMTESVPKALLPVAGQPFIEHQLRLLKDRGISRVVMCVGYLGERIRDFVGDGSRFGLNVDYSFDGAVLRGTGGAIRNALPLLGESFFVLYGDSYLLCDYFEVAAAFYASGRSGLMTVFRNTGRWDTSNVAFAAGEILAYDKTVRDGNMQYIDYGLGVFRATAFADLPDDKPSDLASVYQSLLARGDLAGLEIHERFYEIGSVAGLQELSDLLAPAAGNNS